MQKKSFRKERINELLQMELARLLRFEVGDERLTSLTVTGVDVSPDLSHAKIYITRLGATNDNMRDVLKALKEAAPGIRSQLASRVRMRIIPELRFKFDDSVEKGRHLQQLIETAMEKDKDHS